MNFRLGGTDATLKVSRHAIERPNVIVRGVRKITILPNLFVSMLEEMRVGIARGAWHQDSWNIQDFIAVGVPEHPMSLAG